LFGAKKDEVLVRRSLSREEEEWCCECFGKPETFDYGLRDTMRYAYVMSKAWDILGYYDIAVGRLMPNTEFLQLDPVSCAFTVCHGFTN
jgi:hypothetical protein